MAIAVGYKKIEMGIKKLGIKLGLKK